VAHLLEHVGSDTLCQSLASAGVSKQIRPAQLHNEADVGLRFK